MDLTGTNDRCLCECGLSVDRQRNLYRHCKSTIHKNRMKIKKNLTMGDSNNINKLNNKIDSNNNNNNQYNTGNLYFITNNYSNAPSFQKINSVFNDTPKNNRKLIDDLISNYDKKTLNKFISNEIIKLYKKINPEEQQFWCVDPSRSNYIYKNNSVWINDYNGEYVFSNTLVPYLNFIKEALDKYSALMIKLTKINNLFKNLYEKKIDPTIMDSVKKTIDVALNGAYEVEIDKKTNENIFYYNNRLYKLEHEIIAERFIKGVKQKLNSEFQVQKTLKNKIMSKEKSNYETMKLKLDRYLNFNIKKNDKEFFENIKKHVSMLGDKKKKIKYTKIIKSILKINPNQ